MEISLLPLLLRVPPCVTKTQLRESKWNQKQHYNVRSGSGGRQWHRPTTTPTTIPTLNASLFVWLYLWIIICIQLMTKIIIIYWNAHYEWTNEWRSFVFIHTPRNNDYPSPELCDKSWVWKRNERQSKVVRCKVIFVRADSFLIFSPDFSSCITSNMRYSVIDVIDRFDSISINRTDVSC